MKKTGRLVVLALATFVLYSCNITLTPDKSSSGSNAKKFNSGETARQMVLPVRVGSATTNRVVKGSKSLS